MCVVMSDGECNEGSVWEAALLAPVQKLDGLAVIVDYNKWQATGRSEEVMALHPLRQKWEAFGWRVKRIDGHDFNQIEEALADIRRMPSDKPTIIIADTIKGRGIDHLSYKPLSHGSTPKNEQEIELCRQQLRDGKENE